MNKWNWMGRILMPLIRIGLGISWLKEGIFKIQAQFTMVGLTDAVVHNTVSPPWFKAFMLQFVEPNTALFNFIIPWGEICVGLGLITGILTFPALLSAIFMNLNYWLANMIYIYPIQLMSATLLIWSVKQANSFTIQSLYEYGRNRWRKLKVLGS
ncbi:DoxX family membrane protein [Marininema halotolerans]|uniref:Thiosulfate dehydrogenase [quinone] large subunit n=1 Tax=Marininema halotolerans TaxID=1155944 RepID=A0A1I6PPE5_9BACL|nr:DoxX family membrane protein [Marininema halotolerans]SFS42082.1 thiosulfate dehydrogenase [quinone] large subunit [Marininema halotolerans]